MKLKKDNAIVKLKARVLANRIATVSTMLLSLATACVATQPAAAYPVELMDCYKTKTIVTPEGAKIRKLIRMPCELTDEWVLHKKLPKQNQGAY